MPKKDPGKDHLFTEHEIVSSVETVVLGSWLMKRPGTSSWWCRITATSGRLIVIGDFDPIIFGTCSASAPRKIVSWIGECPGNDTYYPPQKAEIGMGIRIAKTVRANGIRREAVFAALAAVRRLHALLELRHEDDHDQRREGREGDAVEMVTIAGPGKSWL